MKLSLLHCVCLLLLHILGAINIEKSRTSSNINCNVCGKERYGLHDIFYANYASRRGGFEPCQGAWCLTCNKLKNHREYPIKGIEEEDYFKLDIGEEDRCICARPGNPFVTMFQCEYCHF